MWTNRFYPCTLLTSGRNPLTLKTYVTIWVSGHKDKPEYFSAVLGAVGVLWPSWTHFTDSATAHFLDMFTHFWFRLGRNLGGGRWSGGGVGVGGWQMKEGTTRRSPKLWCGFSWGINDWTGFSFILLLLEGNAAKRHLCMHVCFRKGEEMHEFLLQSSQMSKCEHSAHAPTARRD